MKKGLIFTIVICISVLITLQTAYSEYERKVVFEEFSEVWCGPCASVAPVLDVWLKNHPEVIPIIYFSYFMENGVKFETPKDEYQKRATFYGVPFYPYGRLNGNALPPNSGYPGFPTDTAGMTALIDTMAKTSPVEIKMLSQYVQNTYNVSVDINSDIEISNKL